MLKNEKLIKKSKDALFYNSLGIFNWSKVTALIIKLILFILIYQFVYLCYLGIVDYKIIKAGKFIPETILENYFISLLDIYSLISISMFDSISLHILLLPIYLLILFILITIIMLIESKKQLNLSAEDLENYTIHKRRYGYLLKLKKGESSDYKYIVENIDEIKETLGIKKEVIVKKYRKKHIKLEFQKDFPNTILEFEEYYKKLKKGFLYLGFKIVNNKIQDNYIALEDYQRVAIVGSSGNGKSNTTNGISTNLIYNFDLIDHILLVDFKGGIEANPIVSFARKNNMSISIATDLVTLNKELINISEINSNRMEYNRKHKLKKFDGKIVYVIYDEFAQIGLYNPKDNEERNMHKNIMSIYSRLHATGRTQKIYNITITQSFLQNSSGIPSDVKTNLNHIQMLYTDNKESINSVFSSDLLEENSLNPKTLQLGEFIQKNKNELIKCKSIKIQDDIENLLYQIEREKYINWYENDNFVSKLLFKLGLESFKKFPVYGTTLEQQRTYTRFYWNNYFNYDLEIETETKTESELQLKCKDQREL